MVLGIQGSMNILNLYLSPLTKPLLSGRCRDCLQFLRRYEPSNLWFRHCPGPERAVLSTRFCRPTTKRHSNHCNISVGSVPNQHDHTRSSSVQINQPLTQIQGSRGHERQSQAARLRHCPGTVSSTRRLQRTLSSLVPTSLTLRATQHAGTDLAVLAVERPRRRESGRSPRPLKLPCRSDGFRMWPFGRDISAALGHACFTITGTKVVRHHLQHAGDEALVHSR
jgi:hypothetical protein